MNKPNDIRSRIELTNWARRILIEAMLQGIPFKTLAWSMNINQSKLSNFALFGSALDDAELKAVCDYLGSNDPVADKISENYYQSYYKDK